MSENLNHRSQWPGEFLLFVPATIDSVGSKGSDYLHQKIQWASYWIISHHYYLVPLDSLFQEPSRQGKELLSWQWPFIYTLRRSHNEDGEYFSTLVILGTSLGIPLTGLCNQWTQAAAMAWDGAWWYGLGGPTTVATKAIRDTTETGRNLEWVAQEGDEYQLSLWDQL